MRVIVTRPGPSARATADRLLDLGHEPVLFPLFRAEHMKEELLAALEIHPGGLVLTSAEACRALAACGPHIADFCRLPVYAVGEATAKAARALGFDKITVGDGDGTALAECIASSFRSTGPALLYLAGEPRSPGLEATLTKRDIPLRSVVCYRMEPLAYSACELADALGAADSILLYSRQAAFRLVALAADGDLLQHSVFFCLSAAIAGALDAVVTEDDWPTRIHVAARPDETALLALLPAGAGRTAR